MDVYQRKAAVVDLIIRKVKLMESGKSMETAELYETILLNGFNKKLLNEILNTLSELNMITFNKELIKRL